MKKILICVMALVCHNSYAVSACDAIPKEKTVGYEKKELCTPKILGKQKCTEVDDYSKPIKETNPAYTKCVDLESAVQDKSEAVGKAAKEKAAAAVEKLKKEIQGKIDNLTKQEGAVRSKLKDLDNVGNIAQGITQQKKLEAEIATVKKSIEVATKDLPSFQAKLKEAQKKAAAGSKKFAELVGNYQGIAIEEVLVSFNLLDVKDKKNPFSASVKVRFGKRIFDVALPHFDVKDLKNNVGPLITAIKGKL